MKTVQTLRYLVITNGIDRNKTVLRGVVMEATTVAAPLDFSLTVKPSRPADTVLKLLHGTGATAAQRCGADSSSAFRVVTPKGKQTGTRQAHYILLVYNTLNLVKL